MPIDRGRVYVRLFYDTHTRAHTHTERMDSTEEINLDYRPCKPAGATYL